MLLAINAQDDGLVTFVMWPACCPDARLSAGFTPDQAGQLLQLLAAELDKVDAA